MKFMKNVEEGEVTLDDGKLTQDEAQAWTDEFLQSKETPPLDQTWADSYEKTTGCSGNQVNIPIMCFICF